MKPTARPVVALVVSGLIVYLLIAYLFLPAFWRVHEKRHPALADAQTITRTGNDIPGDPVNLALVGPEELVHRGMLAAGWYPADPITLESSLRLAKDVVFRKPYVDAPVSNLYLFGRKEDLAFEKPVGDDPSKRHHVRYWKSDKLDETGRPLWYGAATLDRSVGFSHDTAQITHHIAPEVDRERTLIIDDLNTAGYVGSVYWIDDFHKKLSGTNGGGDPWQTDGRLAVAELKAASPATLPAAATSPATVITKPAAGATQTSNR